MKEEEKKVRYANEYALDFCIVQQEKNRIISIDSTPYCEIIVRKFDRGFIY
jgi:hypothetical protein